MLGKLICSTRQLTSWTCNACRRAYGEVTDHRRGPSCAARKLQHCCLYRLVVNILCWWGVGIPTNQKYGILKESPLHKLEDQAQSSCMEVIEVSPSLYCGVLAGSDETHSIDLPGVYVAEYYIVWTHVFDREKDINCASCWLPNHLVHS